MFKVIYRMDGRWYEEMTNSYDEAVRIKDFFKRENLCDTIHIRQISA